MADETTLPDPVLVATTTKNCCEAPSLNKESNAGPLLPTTDTTWYPQCVGQGTVVQVADLIDPESWVS